MDSFSRRSFDLPTRHHADWLPSFDLIEKNNEYVIRVEAPGMKKTDFNLTVKDGVLTLSGEKTAEESKNDDYYTHRESSYGRFSRSFRLPDEVKENKIKANYKNGVLAIAVPRSKPVEAKEVDIEIG